MLIPDIIVALSPVIFPFALILPPNVEIPTTLSVDVLTFKVLPTPVKLEPSP